ncbi:ligand-binding sensor domain-containing protein [Neolewinella persica]|uniref:ligand-binding sensor domain-containing protein n=1 Tax=Neolewinella persica TaxID=70998 RepID=UPI0012FC861A|nr:triple tyrosine motif-containing protein [Neolewinella persica]
MPNRLLQVCLFVATTLTLLQAQPLRIEYFTVNDGLSTREINDLHIGADGFLWVSTMDGLNRFDGQRFRRFGEGTADEGPGLSRGAVAGVEADNEGKLVVTFHDFFGYFDRFDPRTFSVEQVRLVPSTGVLGYPRAITTDTLGRTFVVTIGSEGTFLYEYTPNGTEESKTFTPIYHDSTDAWTTLTPRVELLAHTSGQFLLYDEEHGFRHLSATGKLISEPFKGRTGVRRFYTFAEAADGRIYLSFRGGIPLFTWRPEANYEPRPVDVDNSGLRYPTIYRDQRGQLLLPATEDILGQQFPDEYGLVDTAGNFMVFEAPLPTQRKVSTVAAVDFRETVYLGLREGLGVVERYVNPVETFLELREGGDIFPNQIRGICEDNTGKVYFMEEDGAIYYRTPGKPTLDTLALTLAEDSTQTLAFRAGAALLYDETANVLWGCGQPVNLAKGGLLFRYDLLRRTTKVYRMDYAPRAMAFGPDGSLYLGVSDPREIGLLFRFDRRREACVPVLKVGESAEKISGLRINCLLAAANGELLIGTGGQGLLGYDPLTGKVKEYELKRAKLKGEEEGAVAGAKEGLGTIFSILETAPGDWWLGTDGGLFHLIDEGADYNHFGRLEGLSSNFVYGMVPDSTGGFWLSTQNGLVHLPADRQAGSVRRYYREDGLSNDEFLPGSALRGKDGRYYFGGVNGVTTFRESDLSSSDAGAEVMLTEIIVYGRNSERRVSKEIRSQRQVTVFAREKSVAISFALPAGKLPSSSQFRYRLEGFNDDWVPLVNERTIRFNNLPSGKYLLRVQGAGANGNYGERELQLAINVRQYVVEKLWFQVMIIVAFAGLIFFILQGRLRERLRNEQLRTQLSADIHDEVSGLLAGITLQAELLKNKTNDETLQARLHTVGEAGRSAMSKMSDVIWSIDSRRDTIGNLLQRMQEHADEVLLPLDIRYDFKASGFDEKKELSGNIRQDVYFIYKEAINNIARHSNATKVEIELEQFAQQFELFIRDNGKPATDTAPPNGLRTSVRAQKTGQGKDNMRMRAARLKGEITIEERGGYTMIFRMKRLG